jgi:hypothetical protein
VCLLITAVTVKHWYTISWLVSGEASLLRWTLWRTNTFTCERVLTELISVWESGSNFGKSLVMRRRIYT